VASFVFEVVNQDEQMVQRGRMLVLVRADAPAGQRAQQHQDAGA
jgi:hypothetical protein